MGTENLGFEVCKVSTYILYIYYIQPHTTEIMPVIFLGKADPQLSKLETSSDGLGPACEVKIGRLLDISLVFLRVLNIISPVVFLYIPILGDIKHRLKWCLDHCSFPMKR